MIKKYYQRKYAPNCKAFMGRPDCTPFLDVFFLLLIFLVLSLPFVQLSGVEVSLPQVNAGQMRAGLERFIITMATAPDGRVQIYFNDKPLTMDALAEELSAVRGKSDMKMVIVRADANTSHAALTEVMTIAGRFGLSTFLATGQAPTPGQRNSGAFSTPSD